MVEVQDVKLKKDITVTLTLKFAVNPLLKQLFILLIIPLPS